MDLPGDRASPRSPDETLRITNYVTQGLTILISTAFVATRFYAKTRVLGGTQGWDDYATYAAWLFMIGYCTCACVASTYGGGLDIDQVPQEHIQPFFKSFYAAAICYAPMALNLKLALLVIIIRVFGAVHKKTLLGVYILIGFLTIYYVSGFFLKIFVCWPISAYWTGDASKCLNQNAIITCDSIISAISDLVILLLPTPLTWSLQLPRRKRLRVIALLCAGGIATAFSVYRLIYTLDNRKNPDVSIIFIKTILSGNAEVGIGLICACLPTINSLYSRKTRGSEYFRHHSDGSKQSHSQRGKIIMTRSYQVDSSSVSNHEAQNLGNDELELVGKPHPYANSTSKTSHESSSAC